MDNIFATVKLQCYMHTRKTPKGKAMVPQQRVLAASNPGTQKSRPRTLFAIGPPSLTNVPQVNGAISAPGPPRPFANGAVPSGHMPALCPPPPQVFPPMQMPSPPSWQGHQQQPGQTVAPPTMQPQPLQHFRPPPPSMPPPSPQMAQMVNRPPPPPAGMAAQFWRPHPPPQQMVGGHHSMQQMSMPPPTPPPNVPPPPPPASS